MKPKRTRKWFLKLRYLIPMAFVLVLVAVTAGVFFYCLHLSDLIDQRFSGRRWSVPSRVYSDSMILYPGQTIPKDVVVAKLTRLGYRPVESRPEIKGRFRAAGSRIDVFLHDLNLPARKRDGFPATIVFKHDAIQSITRTDDKTEEPILELEPEEVMLFFGPEREQRRLVSIGHVPYHLTAAILAAEDNRYYDHHGLDPRGIARALWINLRYGGVRQGGSTITQQLAKNYFLTPEKTLTRKVREMFLALTMEFMFKKDEILEIYLNEIYMGQKGSVSINGVGEACRFYFGKDVSEISLAEAAELAGLIRAPNLYSPYVNPERCRERRNYVLNSMRKLGWITEQELLSAQSKPVSAAGYRPKGKTAPYFMDYLSEQLVQLYPPTALASLGLSIYTTLDTQVQTAAEQALQQGLDRLERDYPKLKRDKPEERLQGAIVVIQPKTGNILAMVGGRDYGVSQFNRITQARRQPGSAFKPFVYLAALDSFTPATPLSNDPRTYTIDGKDWRPQNSHEDSGGDVSFRTALAKSINIATVDLAMKTGLEKIIRTASALGISTPLKPYPSLALGAFEVMPLELARAYCAFAADGALPFPLSLKEAVDDKGKVLERRHVTIQPVISPAEAYIMDSLLHSVTTEGTARSLERRGITFPAAGKTGTSSDYRDGWFVGYTPDILTLVWVGFDQGDSMGVSASTAALPIWAEFMKSIPWQMSGGWFRMPPGVVTRVICEDSGMLAVNSCPRPVQEVFLENNAPSEPCTLHKDNWSLIKKLRSLIKDLSTIDGTQNEQKKEPW